MERLLASLPLSDLIMLAISIFNIIYFLDVLFLSKEKNVSSAIFSVFPFIVTFLIYVLFTCVAHFEKMTSCCYAISFFVVLLYMFHRTNENPCNIVTEE